MKSKKQNNFSFVQKQWQIFSLIWLAMRAIFPKLILRTFDTVLYQPYLDTAVCMNAHSIRFKTSQNESFLNISNLVTNRQLMTTKVNNYIIVNICATGRTYLHLFKLLSIDTEYKTKVTEHTALYV
jgi:hypothetical protein